jgi:sugar lactone lactonase YvrE
LITVSKKIMQQKWEVVVEYVCELGEGPVWDAATQSILWVDILQCGLHRFFPEQKEHKVFHTGSMIGAIALRESGGIIAALQNGFAEIDLEKGTLQSITNTEAFIETNRFNDGKADPAGRFWAGTMSVKGDVGAGCLYALERDLSVSLKIKGVSCSNGMAWSPDHKTFYYIDTPTQQIVSYDYNITDGSISGKKIVITIPREAGCPDGMTIDSEGMLWIACWDGWSVMRWNPHTGELLQCIALPVSKVTSCTFGGNNLEDLYITTARVGLTGPELKEQPLSGSLFVIKNTGFTGLADFPFKG